MVTKKNVSFLRTLNFGCRGLQLLGAFFFGGMRREKTIRKIRRFTTSELEEQQLYSKTLILSDYRQLKKKKRENTY